MIPPDPVQVPGRIGTACHALKLLLCAGLVMLFSWSVNLSMLRQATAGTADTRTIVHIGISHASFGQISANDANAALKAWAVSVLRERDSKIKPEVRVFENPVELRESLVKGNLDFVTMIPEEFIDSDQHPREVLVVSRGGGFKEHYALVTHSASGIRHISDLRGKRLVRNSSQRDTLSMPWLELQLGTNSLPAASSFFKEIRSMETPSKAVLMVFFRQADACLVKLTALETARELNPQLNRDLQVLALSPGIIPSVAFFRDNWADPMRQDLETTMLNLHATPAGQQVLTVFQGSALQKIEITEFNETRALLEAFRQMTTNRTTPATRAEERSRPTLRDPNP